MVRKKVAPSPLRTIILRGDGRTAQAKPTKKIRADPQLFAGCGGLDSLLDIDSLELRRTAMPIANCAFHTQNNSSRRRASGALVAASTCVARASLFLICFDGEYRNIGTPGTRTLIRIESNGRDRYVYVSFYHCMLLTYIGGL